MKDTRVYLFAGHYGSGKTNIAVNFALRLRNEGKRVAVADLDIVNPYFRTKDSERELREAGVDLICSEYANTNLDIPALPQETYRLVTRDDSYAVFDVGGDDRGALALGRYVPFIKEEGRYDMYFVVNFARPLTPNAEEAITIMREIEAAANLPFTGIINNTNIGHETTKETVCASQEEAKRLSDMTGLPLVMTTVEQSLSKAFHEEEIPDIFPIRLQPKYFDIGRSSVWQN